MVARAPKGLIGAEVTPFPKVSVGATENLLMAADSWPRATTHPRSTPRGSRRSPTSPNA